MNQEQFCPACKTEVSTSPRYPNYICGDCVDKGQSEDGRLVKFYNEDLGGFGCVGEYVDTKAKYEGNILYVNGVKCYAQEAHFGGIVIRPVAE
jgi:hypothetical protein